MGHERKYDTETRAGRNAAYADAREWLGAERLELIETAVKNGTIDTVDQLHLVANFAGLGGFPVRVIGEKNGLYD